MSRTLQNLPAALLDELVTHALKLSPSLRITFLASLGCRIHASAVRVLFSTLAVPDDGRIFETNGRSVKSIITALLSNPERYAQTVTSLVVRDPDFNTAFSYQKASYLFSDGQAYNMLDSPKNLRPIDAENLSSILEVCSNLEEFAWESSIPPPDGLCEMLIAHNTRITSIHCTPSSHLWGSAHSSRSILSKWDGPSLPLLSNLALTSLHLSRLSQAGARALSALLSNIGEFSTLEDVGIDLVWLDDPLCEKMVEAGRRIRKLKLGTSGTKLSDKGIIAIVEGCDSLEELVLEDVQGRLSRSLWTKPSVFPAGLKHLKIATSEAGSHHSWTTDHLLSLHAVPLQSLASFSIVRRESLPQVENGTPVFETVVDDVVALKPVPQDFVDKMREAKSLTSFECDWWSWSIVDLKVILESSPKLETLKICLNAPCSKLMSLTSPFASLPHLHKFSICVDPLHAPGKPPVPLLPFSQPSLPTPSASPVLRGKSVLPQLLDYDQMQTQTCVAADVTGDPSMPLLRDVKRFVRKCPKLDFFAWYGKAGRGSWIVTRPATTASKTSINISVEYAPPTITEDIWKAMLRENSMEEASHRGWMANGIERVGQAWIGDMADALAVERLAEKDKEECTSPVEKDRQGRHREFGKKTKLPPVSTSSSEAHSHHQLLTPTCSTHSRTSVQASSPLTPPHSETSISAMLSSVSESTESASSHENDHHLRDARKRSPSEPIPHINGAYKGRSRSVTASANKDGSNPTRNGYYSKNNGSTANPTVGTGHKPGRGRGRGGASAGRKLATGDSTGGPTANGAGRGRGGRGARSPTSTSSGPVRGRRPSAH